ncbi:hypothetical protein [Burkholderia mayonis]|uniref:Uncharacterized protein n=1 Tax=Burkholderia mayonis TaxID=1385591 RepID=A0A1B4G210_9BURK|nr:hypothetical protein WS71_22110 [Burkholderia mayonis]KVE58685.1 hypothetical protein WS71_24055 [Burkholderia mayonis]
MMPLQATTHAPIEDVRESTERDTPTSPVSLDEIMNQWLINDFKQKVMFPDPDDPSACPTFDGNGNW